MSAEIKQEFDSALAQITGVGAPYELGGDSETGYFYVNAPSTVREVVAPAREHGDREFLIYEGERRSFNQVMDEADEIAAALQAHGVVPGDRVAIAMRNYPEWMALFLAIIDIGAIAVPVNSWGKPADIVYTIVDAQAKMAFCDQARYNGVADLLAEKGIASIVVRPENADDQRSLGAFIGDHKGAKPNVVALNPDDLAMIMYTSGTSGKPKGAASTHRALGQAIFNMECSSIASAMTNGELIGAMMERGFEPTALLAVPLFHVSGCHAQFLVNFRGGRRVVMMFKWDVDRALQYIEQDRVTTLAAAPAMVLDLLESPKFATTDTSSLFSLGIGGAATPPKIAALIGEQLPQNLSGTGYGMTETNAQGASLMGQAFHLKPGCSGFPHPVVDFRICDEAGDDLPAGEAGEIWVRSCANIVEYWNQPEANAADFRGDWLKTGDVGYLDADGFLYLADRAKDMIIRGGENIYPIEIENQLIEHDAVKEVVAIGIPNERLGEEVGVVLYLNPGAQADREEIVRYCKEHLAGYKVPTHVFYSDEPMPRNATNKILKRDVKAGVLETLAG